MRSYFPNALNSLEQLQELVQPGPNTGPITPPHPWGPGREETDRQREKQRDTQIHTHIQAEKDRDTGTERQRQKQRLRKTHRRRGSTPGHCKKERDKQDSQSPCQAWGPSAGPEGLRAWSPVLQSHEAGLWGLARDPHQPTLQAEPDVSTGTWPAWGSGPSGRTSSLPSVALCPSSHTPCSPSGNSFSNSNIPPRRMRGHGIQEEDANKGMEGW